MVFITNNSCFCLVIKPCKREVFNTSILLCSIRCLVAFFVSKISSDLNLFYKFQNLSLNLIDNRVNKLQTIF